MPSQSASPVTKPIQNLPTGSLEPNLYLNRDLSLLEFNRRVVAQAEDESLPLLERLRYLCIGSSNLDEFFEKNPDGRYFYATTKAPHAYHEVEYRDGDYLMFGKETRGLPEPLLIEHPERCVRIPMREGARSLNLSNSVAVIVFEALRQTGFENLKLAGPFPQA